jgi:ferredoxin
MLARINPSLCKGCGTCASWCPSGAITACHYTDKQVNAMIDAFFGDDFFGEDKILGEEGLMNKGADA